MKFTVADCLKLASFDGAKVLAAKDYLVNSVKNVSVLESTDPADIKKYAGGEEQLLLTSFFDVKKDEKAQVAAVKAVANLGAAGLVVTRVGKVVTKLSKAVINCAAEEGLPLIEVPAGSGFNTGDLIREVTERILWGEGDDQSENLINNTIFHLLNFEKYGNFQAAIKAACLANDFQMILLSENFNPIFSVETRHRATISDAIKLGKERSVEKQDQVYTMINVNGVLTYWGPVMIQDEKYFMFIVDNEDLYTAGDITKLAEIIELAMGMWKYSPQRDVRTEFIKALRRGNASLAYGLLDEVGIEPEQIVGVFYAVEGQKGAAKKMTKELDQAKGMTSIYLTEEEDTYGILITDDDVKDASTAVIDIYNKYKGNQDLTIHHITGLKGVEGAADAFGLIGETNAFAKSIFPYKSVFTKYEMALISNCLHIQLAGGNVRKNYLEFFDPFDRLGDLKRTQLMETLETFVLDAGMNNAKTASYMDIHANTVQYRLRKIDDLMGAEITGNRVIPGMTIALALLRLERVVGNE